MIKKKNQVEILVTNMKYTTLEDVRFCLYLCGMEGLREKERKKERKREREREKERKKRMRNRKDDRE